MVAGVDGFMVVVAAAYKPRPTFLASIMVYGRCLNFVTVGLALALCIQAWTHIQFALLF